MATKLMIFSMLTFLIEFNILTKNVHSEKPWPENLHQHFPYETHSPMDIDSSKARKYETNDNPLTTTVTHNRSLILYNNGYEVVTLPVGDVGRLLSGGILGKNKYKFYKGRFIWSNSACVPAASIVDGIGTPLEIIVVYYKENYNSFENALHHPDGIAIYSVRVSVKKKSKNKLFGQVQPYFEAVQNFNASITMPVEVMSAWYKDCIKAPYFYYGYPGSYIDFITKKEYYSATIIVHPLRPTLCYISEQQFQVFQRFRNQQGNFYHNELTSYPTDCRPVVEASPTKASIPN